MEQPEPANVWVSVEVEQSGACAHHAAKGMYSRELVAEFMLCSCHKFVTDTYHERGHKLATTHAFGNIVRRRTHMLSLNASPNIGATCPLRCPTKATLCNCCPLGLGGKRSSLAQGKSYTIASNMWVASRFAGI